MIATSAYYLLSPFNLILFLFPQRMLPIAIVTVIGLKFGFCGLSSYYYWSKIQKIDHYYSLAASIAYALSGFMVANYYNLMWLDTVILLPLLVASIDQILHRKKDHLILITFLIWFTNFYTGVMALFFGLLYFVSQIFFISKQDRKSIFFVYLKKSILGSFLCSFILLPVFFELLTSRANDSATWAISWQFRPDKELAKMALGSYSFHEMEDGMPNIFMTTPFVLLAISYFLRHGISWQKRLTNGIFLLFLLLSLDFTPFVLFWHLGQFPIWYPGRFSFVVIFFCINLALSSLEEKKDLALWSKILIGLFAIILVGYCYFTQDNFTFFDESSLLLTTLFIVLALLFIYFIYSHHSFEKGFFISIVVLEAIVNLILSLNNLSFQNNQDYQNFASNMSNVSDVIKNTDQTFYRTEKTFSRSDDDPFTANYNGISNFNSITDRTALDFLSNLGYLHNSNSFNNLGGTPISDNLLGIKYYLQPNYADSKNGKQQKIVFSNSNERQDVNSYPLVKKLPQLLIRKNSVAISPVFLIKDSEDKLKFINDDPALNQERFLNYVLGKNSRVLTTVKMPRAKLENVKQIVNTNSYIQKKNKDKTSVSYNLKLTSNDSYYLQMPYGLDENELSLTNNGKDIDLEVRDAQTHLINLANGQKNLRLNLKFELLQPQVDFSGIQLIRVNTKKLNHELKDFQKGQPKIYQVNVLCLKSNHFTSKNQQLLTTIPFSHNWLIFDNGHKLKTKAFKGVFLQAKLENGKHQLTFIYIPWIFLIGLVLSLITLIMIKCIR